MTRHAVEEPSASVVVVAYRRPQALAALLDALDGSSAEVVVVNVGDDPEVRAAASRARVPVRTFAIANRGFGAAVNAGAAAARGDVVVFTNDDVVIDASAVSTLVRSVHDDVDVALPRVVNCDGQEQRTVRALPTPGRLLLEWALLPDRPIRTLDRWSRVEKWRSPRTVERVVAASAVTVAVRADVLRETPLPEEYFLYWEELEWFWRLRERGRRLVMVPAVDVVHGGGHADVRPEKSRLLARNAVRCVRRTQGRAAALAAFVIVIVWNARLFLLDGLRWAVSAREESAPRFAARRAGLEAALASWRELR